MSQTARVSAVAQVAPGVHQLTLAVAPDFSFKAGQFVILPVPPQPGAEAPVKPLKGFYSVASAPASLPDLQLLVEHREGGGPVSAWASSRSVGEELALEGPLGHFGLLEPAQGPCLFLGRRAGIAPLRSLLLHALSQGHEATLFLGGDSAADWLLHDEWLALAASEPRFKYVPLLGSGAELAAAAQAADVKDARYHLAGFTREVAPAYEALLSAGIDAARIKAEKFG